MSRNRLTTKQIGINLDQDSIKALINEANMLLEDSITQTTAHIKKLKREMVDLSSLAVLGKQNIDAITLISRFSKQKVEMAKFIHEVNTTKENNTDEVDSFKSANLLGQLEEMRRKQKDN